MAYERKNFNELRGLNFNSKDDKFSYKSDKIITNHGFEYQKYDMNLSARDLLTKNYTSNFDHTLFNFTKASSIWTAFNAAPFPYTLSATIHIDTQVSSFISCTLILPT